MCCFKNLQGIELNTPLKKKISSMCKIFLKTAFLKHIKDIKRHF